MDEDESGELTRSVFEARADDEESRIDRLCYSGSQTRDEGKTDRSFIAGNTDQTCSNEAVPGVDAIPELWDRAAGEWNGLTGEDKIGRHGADRGHGKWQVLRDAAERASP